MPDAPQRTSNPATARRISLDWWERIAVSFRHGNLYPCKPQWHIPPERMAHYCLFLITHGRGWVECDGQREIAMPNHLFLFRKGGTISAGHDPAHPVTVYSVGFEVKSAEGLDPLHQASWPLLLRLTPTLCGPMMGMFERFVASYAEPTAVGKVTCRGEFLLLLAYVMNLIDTLPPANQVQRAMRAAREESRVAALQTYIEQHLDDALSSASLARISKMTPSHLAYLFRQELGLSPMDYVRHRRIVHAKALLAREDTPVSEIAQRVGYVDPYHFSRVFHRVAGLSPRDYRQSCKHPF